MTTLQIQPQKLKYPFVVREDYATDGTRTIVAEIPELVGCMSHGDTPEEALRNLEEAAELYLEALGDNPPLAPEVPLTTGTGLEGADVVMDDAVEGVKTKLEIRVA